MTDSAALFIYTTMLVGSKVVYYKINGGRNSQLLVWAVNCVLKFAASHLL